MKKKLFHFKAHPAVMVIFVCAFVFLDSRLVLSAACALLLHEAAHLIVMRICGIQKYTIDLTPFGGMIDAETFESQKAYRQFFCALAGAAANAGAALLCYRFAPHTDFWYRFLCANVSLAAVNMLPAWPLDGARMVYAAASWFGAERQAGKLLLFLTCLLAIFFIAVGLYGVWHGVLNISLLLMGPYLLYAAGTERIARGVRSLVPDNYPAQQFMPASVWACSSHRASEQFGLFLARKDSRQYGLYVQIDPLTNAVKKIWTEGEIRETVFQTPEIDTAKT